MSTQATMKEYKGPDLLSTLLPLELKAMIFSHLLPAQEPPTNAKPARYQVQTSLLRVNERLHHDGVWYLYTTSTFIRTKWYINTLIQDAVEPDDRVQVVPWFLYESALKDWSLPYVIDAPFIKKPGYFVDWKDTRSNLSSEDEAGLEAQLQAKINEKVRQVQDAQASERCSSGV